MISSRLNNIFDVLKNDALFENEHCFLNNVLINDKFDNITDQCLR